MMANKQLLKRPDGDSSKAPTKYNDVSYCCDSFTSLHINNSTDSNDGHCLDIQIAHLNRQTHFLQNKQQCWHLKWSF